MSASDRDRTSLLQRTGLIALGLFLTALILEATLRLGGCIILSQQAHRNVLAMRRKNVYRILCIGESTTQKQYPAFLERTLNGRNLGINFSVIDRGLGGTTTAFLVDRLESDLDAYHPDMVVAMMGINDSGPHMPYVPETSSRIVQFIRTWRTYKLVRIAWQHMESLGRRAGEVSHGIFVKQGERDQPDLHPGGDWAYIQLGQVYQEEGRLTEAVAARRKAVEINPRNAEAYARLGQVYREQGKLAEAAAALKKAVEIDPGNYWVRVELGWLYKAQRRYKEEEESFRVALEISQRYSDAFGGLGDVYLRQGKMARATAAFKKVLEINPSDDGALAGLGWVYEKEGKSAEAVAAFKAAVKSKPKSEGADTFLKEIHRLQGKAADGEGSFQKDLETKPRNSMDLLGIGSAYREKGRFLEVAVAAKNSLEIDPGKSAGYEGLILAYLWGRGNLSELRGLLEKSAKGVSAPTERTCGALATLYAAMGDSRRAAQYQQRAQQLRLKEFDAVTVKSYLRLKAMADRRGVKLVCVQYPMRSLEPLRRVFQGRDDGIIFVDNEAVFKQAVARESLQEYFRDMFAGDFGHCTDKGNALLAGDIADVVAREFFRK